MEVNQLENNEILVEPEIINHWIEECKGTTQEGVKIEKVWRYHELWLITLVFHEHMYDLCKNPERLDTLYEFMDFMLNDQTRFLQNFFYFETNKIWKGPKEPHILPIDLDKIDYLNVKWKDEIQPNSANQFWHLHLRVSIVQRPTRGLSMKFNSRFLHQLTTELFNDRFHVKVNYRANDLSKIDFYIDKNARGELK